MSFLPLARHFWSLDPHDLRALRSGGVAGTRAADDPYQRAAQAGDLVGADDLVEMAALAGGAALVATAKKPVVERISAAEQRALPEPA